MSTAFSQTNLSITQTKALIKYNFRQFIDNGPGKYLPLSLWGHAGVGKTSIVNQVAAELAEELTQERGVKVSIKVRYNQMSAMQPFELSGYPFIDEKSYGGKFVQRYAEPEFLTEATKFTYYILFFDEWNRARTEMHNAFMGYIDGRGVNGHGVPSNLFCICAANPVTDDSTYGAVTDVGDQAILDRLTHINLIPTTEEFMTYLQLDKGIHESVQAFLSEDTSRLPKNEFTGITGTIRDTNRGAADVGRAINYIKDENNVSLRMSLIEAVAKGIIGDKNGSIYANRFGQFEFLATPQDILKGESSALVRIESAVNKDAKGAARLDQVSKVVDNMVRVLNEAGRKALTSAQIKNLNLFMDLIPHDMAEQLFTKVKFKSSELKAGIKSRMISTLQVTSGEVEAPVWR